jgi:hypothetical protein
MSCKDEPVNLLDNQGGEACGPNTDFDLSKSKDILYQDKLVEEALNIGGATVNVFKLLGIHEQGQLIDLTGNGHPISGGDGQDWPASSAFSTTSCTNWRSEQKGQDVIRSGYIGYDFGPVYNHEDDRNVYGVETYEHKHIATMVIQQGPAQKNRATKVRIERSLYGDKWLGVDIVELPDDGEVNMIHFKGSAASRFWRIRPIEFNGVETNSNWEVVQLQLMDYDKTSLYNIQDDMGFLESRDRDYAHESVEIKGSYDLLDIQTDVGMFGAMPGQQNLFLMVSFSQCVRRLGRPPVIGDILEIPSEAQWSHDLQRVKKYMEITDVAWSTEGYTPGWQPTTLRLVIEPMLSSQETLDIIGDIKQPDDIGFLDIDDEEYTDLTDVADRVQSKADIHVQERGTDQYEVAAIEEEVIQEYANQGIDVRKLSSNQRNLYIEDGLPPNGEPYTEGTKFPENPQDRDYHRLTYNSDLKIPARLFRYSTIKNKWIFCEADRREQYNTLKPSLQNKITSKNAVDVNKVTDTAECQNSSDPTGPSEPEDICGNE